MESNDDIRSKWLGEQKGCIHKNLGIVSHRCSWETNSHDKTAQKDAEALEVPQRKEKKYIERKIGTAN